MEAAARQEDLQVLGQLLQERLQSEFPEAISLKVQCAIKDGTLIVSSQHPASVTLDSHPTFAAIQQTLESLQPQVPQSVQLYLRVADQSRPYAVDCFILQPSSLTLAKPAELESWDKPAPEQENQNPNNWGAPTANVDTTSRWHQSKLPVPILVAGAGVILAASISGAYLLSPCVIGECKPIQTAQQLSQKSAFLTRRAKSPQQLTAAQQQLTAASNALQTIPPWATRYQEAQQLLQTFSTQSEKLNQAVTALQKASAAAQNTQNPPHTVQEWQAIQALWQGAIAPLAAVTRNSALYPVAQQKLPGYRANLESVNQQLKAEQQIAKKLTLALTTAQVATTRQGSAQTLQNWQQVQSTWQTAINSLASIPKNSTAYKEAQRLLATYRPKLAAVGDRTTKEQTAVTAYNRAISLAKLAQRYEQQNQLNASVINWNQALSYAKQVPAGTFYYTKAQPLIDSYSSALQQAQQKLRVANIWQKARADLERTCSGSIQFCNYSLNSQGIRVQLTSNYERVVEQSLLNANVQGDPNTQAAVVKHYQILRQALKAISDNASLPLQVYDSKGSPIYIYQLGGIGNLDQVGR